MGHTVTLPREELELLEEKARLVDRLFSVKGDYPFLKETSSFVGMTAISKIIPMNKEVLLRLFELSGQTFAVDHNSPTWEPNNPEIKRALDEAEVLIRLQ